MNNIAPNPPKVKSAVQLTLKHHQEALSLIREKIRVRGYVCYSEVQALLLAYDALTKAALADAENPKPKDKVDQDRLERALQQLEACQELSYSTRQFLQQAFDIRSDYPRAFNSLALPA